jgi:hypothetical protein
MVSATSETSSSAVTNGGQICSVLLWIVRISPPDSTRTLHKRKPLMNDLDLTKFKALSFDCYGTLIDWEAGIAAVLSLWAREQGLDLTDEELLLAYADNEAAVERETPSALYPDVLAAAFRRTADMLGRSVSDVWAQRLGNSVPDWPVFADSADALARLAKHYRLIILSNVHRDGFAGSNRRLRGEFRRHHHRRGRRRLQASREPLPRPGHNARRTRRGAYCPAARGPKLVPRSRPRQAGGHAVGVDQPPPRPPRLGRYPRAVR